MTMLKTTMLRAKPQRANVSHNKPTIRSAVGLYKFSPARVALPETEAQIVRAIHQAAKSKQRIRAIGALHSAVPLPATVGICLSLERYQKVLQITDNLVTVQSGIRLKTLNNFLAAHNLALPTLGTIAQQSISGAVSTGTHGGSLHQTSLSGCVHSFRLVLANGEILELTKGEDLFDAVAIALGALGILSTLTLRCVPAFSLRARILSLPAPQLIEQFNNINEQNQFVDIRYSPITDRAHLALMNPTVSPTVVTDSKPDSKHSEQPLSPQRNLIPASLTNFTHKTAQKLFNTHKFNWLQRWGIERYDKNIYREVTGRSDFVLTHFDTTSTELLAHEEFTNADPTADMEVAVRYALAAEALATLRHHFQQTQQFPSMHIHIRTQAGEPFWLSPTQGKAICWFEFWEYPRTGKFFEKMMNLLAPYEPRAHWGKQLFADPSTQYPRWKDFINLRAQLDPTGMFLNRYLEQIGFNN